MKIILFISILANFGLGYVAVQLLDSHVKLGYSSEALTRTKESFDDLASLYPKTLTKKDLMKSWVGDEVKPYEDYKKTGLKFGEVVVYFNGDKTIKAFRTSYQPYLEKQE
jgi:hypothetical protein